jgi:hypothetical protein
VIDCPGIAAGNGAAGIGGAFGRRCVYFLYLLVVLVVCLGGPWSIARSIQIHARITWGVALIRAILFIFFLYVLTDMTTTIHVRFISNVRLTRYVKSVFLVHVGGTRCVTSNTDHIIKIQAPDHFEC